MSDFARCDEMVLATKVHGRMHDGPVSPSLAILLDNAIAAVDLELGDEKVARLEKERG